ncbi:Pollen-specific leucine-rich repeat extensin-like protein 2 [Ananas comosus]|uniref:Cell wall hydroxyproline-rich glycoprotein n=1 Tax=Ananas comosus TaxID=4615 RepID=A0A199VSZ7_ANACO|nr:Pollen-specific leucine-rich repeat extensin-like protein 2 [Ananas comosus]
MALPLLLLLLLLSSFAISADSSPASRRLLHFFSFDFPFHAFHFGFEPDYEPVESHEAVVAAPPPHPRLQRAHSALQAWKRAIVSDPTNFTSNWVGDDVCSYNGVFCAPALDDPSLHVVAGVDLNGAGLAGRLPDEIGRLADAAILHLNSNRFAGPLPDTLSDLALLHELDLSNNNFSGPFPQSVLRLAGLKYLDLRFNDFHGPLPPELFDRDLDALFLNDNRFDSCIPENFGNIKASAVVLANNKFTGCVPRSVGRMRSTLNEIVLSNNELTGCLPPEIGSLTRLTVMDVSQNFLSGGLPESFSRLKDVEQLNLAHNTLVGAVPDWACRLERLENLSVSDNYFTRVASSCRERSGDVAFDDVNNCLSGVIGQKLPAECAAPVLSGFSVCGGLPRSMPLPPSSLDVRAFVSPPPLPPPPRPKCVPAPRSAPLPPPSSFGVLPPVGGIRYASPPPPLPIFNGY